MTYLYPNQPLETNFDLLWLCDNLPPGGDGAKEVITFKYYSDLKFHFIWGPYYDPDDLIHTLIFWQIETRESNCGTTSREFIPVYNDEPRKGQTE